MDQGKTDREDIESSVPKPELMTDRFFSVAKEKHYQ